MTTLSSQPELIEAHGYKAEIHEIWTEDGYGLNVHRVLPPNDRVSNVDSINANSNNSIEYHDSLNSAKASCTSISPRLPVLLCHGFICSSADWVLLGPQKALGNQIFLTNIFLVFIFSNRFSFPFSFIFYFMFLLFTAIALPKNIFQVSKNLRN